MGAQTLSFWWTAHQNVTCQMLMPSLWPFGFRAGVAKETQFFLQLAGPRLSPFCRCVN